MAKRKKVAEPESTIEMSINGHQLSGEQRGGVWAFQCPDWPDLVEKWNGDTIATNIIGAFTSRALAGAVRFRMIAAEITRG